MSVPTRIRAFLSEIEGAYTRQEIAEKLRPEISDDEWSEWAESNAWSAFVRLIGDLDRGRRAEIRRHEIAQVIGRIEEGDVEAGHFFAMSVEVDDSGRQMLLGNMVGVDCDSAAGLYENRGTFALALSSFMEALGKKQRSQPRREVYTEEQLQRMYDSIVRRNR